MSKRTKTRNKKQETVRPIAVIDIGTSSVRMAIAQVKQGSIEILDTLHQSISLGKDTFSRGRITLGTTEQCVQALRSFRHILDEYSIHEDAQIRAVATSAVREAANRQAFLDRAYSATGLDVEAIDEMEVNRYTYLGMRELLKKDKTLKKTDSLLIEVGSGSTSLLLVTNDEVQFSQSYRLGSLRIREILEDAHASTLRLPQLMEEYIQRTVSEVRQNVHFDENARMVILGSDARFAATHLYPDWDRESVIGLPLERLMPFVNELLSRSVDEVARQYHIPLSDAETLGPALLIYARLAIVLGRKRVYVATRSLRDGLLAEMAAQTLSAPELTRQTLHSAVELGRKYDFDQKDNENVADLCLRIFKAMQDEHHLSERHELLLHVSALLHEIGRFISERSHHKHSMYLIQNSEIFGLTAKEKLLVSLVARYHRRAMPKLSHREFSDLPRDDRIIVSQLAGILCVADALNCRHQQRIRRLRITVKPDRILLTTRDVSDVSIEQVTLRQKVRLFEQAYGKSVILQAAG